MSQFYQGVVPGMLPPSVPTSFVTNSGTATPVANVIDIVGGTGITTSGSGDTVTISLTGTGATETLTGNTGGAISPTANNINTLGTGSITIAGSGSTLTTQLTGLTNHAVLVGAGTATITKIGPTANTGAILQNNAGADPSYSTATYPSIAGTSGNVLTSNGTNFVSQTPQIQVVQLALTNSQLKNINTTPVTLIAAPGAGKVINLIYVSGLFTYGGTNAFTGSNTLEAYFGTAAGPLAGQFIFSSTMVGTTTAYSSPAGSATGFGSSAAQSSCDNTAIVVSAFANYGGNAAGNNTATVIAVYTILSL